MSTLAEAFPVAAVEAEKALVGAMLIDRAPLELLELLDDDVDLTLPTLRTVVAAIRRLVIAGTPVDPVTVLGELRRSGETVTAAGQGDVGLLLIEYAEASPVPASARHYFQAVVEASLRRRLLEVGTRLAQMASSSALDDVRRRYLADVVTTAGLYARLDRVIK
jgi:replicative DNA helicase